MLKIKTQKLLGLTLIEMMMAIAIFAIGIAGFSQLFINAWRNNSYTIEMGESAFTASRGVNKAVEYVRKARQGDDGSYPIKSVGNSDLVLYCDFDNDAITERLHFYLSAGTFFMGVTDPTSGFPKTYPSGDQQAIVLANRIVNTSSDPLFYYYNNNYPGDTTHNPLTSPIDVTTVRLVKIRLKININPNRAPDNIEMESFAELRNLNDYAGVQ
jgi:prepilin-type N-terminal cleavage/methylation domain-containing protein